MKGVSPARPKLLSKLNQSIVLDSIRQHGPSTRAEMSSRLGVTFPTANKAVAALLEARLLEEYDDDHVSRGRPAKRVRLATEFAQVIGVELDGRTCQIVAAGFDGKSLPSTLASFSTPSSYPQLLSTLENQLRPLLSSETKTTLGIGVTVPGLVDRSDQTVHFSANLPILNQQPIVENISSFAGVPCTMVHDSHALCLAECMFGTDAEHSQSFVMLVHRVGIGLGVMINGQFLTGRDGFAGEIGHAPMIANGRRCSCGRKGCLETVASEWSMLQELSKQIERTATMQELIVLAEKGDSFVMDLLTQSCHFLAMTVANVINLFNPGIVYVHGRLFREVPWLMGKLEKETGQMALTPAMERCEFRLAGTSLLDGSIATIIDHIISLRQS
ncbi:ROK family transcriptional regulator [Novipirellula artificiosorum]|uniref:N-acetylglucosamine repressor n=1 Tax=Novipirellula artificiosorum TaxID=2528016 RepID=A0A5C6DGH8_9BACT|nr:ROK family transcriptional regulator [Novipirellula artificiosorum]TWU34927.1 N-acetylglucosamine repressor [Novipirellula artificiosorum]